MSKERQIIDKRRAKPTQEGAGVRLNRVFGQADERLDPFLLLDHFGSDRPEDYMAGFPWHPHRGIETVTYMLAGKVEHGDSLGNSGVIGPGDVQWMTAGAGIVHQEMPQRAPILEGFQLWCNLPQSHKMTPPRYREVNAAALVDLDLAPGASAKLVCGTYEGMSGPIHDVVTEPLYLDIHLEPETTLDLSMNGGRNAFAYLYRGSAVFAGGESVQKLELAVFGEGSLLPVQAGNQGARMLLVAGKPIGEPVAWGGPIVMNTEEELRIAFGEYRDGSFLKHD
jgi:redox-sensitive bicupin YhaK (pirin superfamily)